MNSYFFISDEPTGRLALVFELMEMNLYDAIKGRRHYLPENRIKYYMYQLVKSIDHMHRNGIFHRDIKPYTTLYFKIEFLNLNCIVKTSYSKKIA